MGWRETLEMELEVAAANALGGGPATPSAAKSAERNMRAVIDRWIAAGRMPGIRGYTLSVEGGDGLSVDLQFHEHTRAKELVIDLKPGRS